MKTEKDFFLKTRCNFTEVEHILTTPDFESGYLSKYWYTAEGVYRYSDHWGMCASCYWTLDDKNRNLMVGWGLTGFAKWEDFKDLDKMPLPEMLRCCC